MKAALSNQSISVKANPQPAVLKTWASALVLIVLIVAFLPTVTDQLLRTWLEFGAFYGHGLLIVGLVADLVWWHRARIFSSRENGSRVLTLLACGVSSGWALAWIAGIDSVRPAMALLTMLLACCAALGRRSLISFGLPFSLIFLAVPMWRPVSLMLQDAATVVVGRLMLLVHVPTHIEANLIQIPAGTIEVETGCSGLGYLLVSCTLAGYLALRYRPRLGTVCTTVAVAALLGIAANWLRIFVIALIAQYGGIDQPIVHNHIWLGWVVYMVLMLPALWIGIRTLESPAATAPGRVEFPGTVGWKFLMVLVIATALPPIAGRTLDHLARAGPGAIVALPDRIEGRRVGGSPTVWVRVYQPSNDTPWEPDFPDADRVATAAYRGSDGSEIMIFTADYDRQTEGREVVGTANDLNGPQWHGAGGGVRRLEVDGEPFGLTERRLVAGADESLCVWYWYRVGGRQVATPMLAKLEQVRQKLLGRADAAIVAAATPVGNASCAPARDRLARFVRGWLGARGP